MKWLIAFLACIGIAQAQIIQHNIPDDGFAHVPLQFGFPLYGRIFTDSYMFSNGVVGFGSVNNSWCCTGFDLANSRGYEFNYSIMGLQTDLINYGSGRFLTEGTTQYQRYKWENISEYGAPQNLNTFGIEIRPSGFIGMYYDQVNISSWRPVTIGVTGDTSQREFSQLYHGNGFSQANFSHIIEITGNVCASNPLSSPSCAGYQEAYLSQQCSLNPLFSANCAGYEQAYFLQQCSINVLYDRNCAGYEQAYHNQQCSLNPLYATTCQGYAEAYALANVVPATTVSTTTPSVQVSTTGTVTLETPVVADPVVNEVITRPQAVSNVQTTTQTQSPVQAVKEPQEQSKNEKKSETKQVAKPTNTTNKNELSTEAPKIVAPVHEYKAPIILDLAYMQMVKKPIKDNNRAMYNLIMNSQYKHEEMVDGQYRR